MKIKPLSEEIIRKIAAGQVVERPASVVKELVENSLDANSTNIKIEITEGGAAQIRVTDNGEGMAEKDLMEAYKLHTTSKIEEESDLYSISTLGFRGEALASIASVGSMSIKSRVKEEVAGHLVEIDQGKLINEASVGMPVGTVVEVRNLFYTIPARKKFLKSSSAEFRYIADVVIAFALAHPDVGFFLAHNKRIILDLPSNQSVAERIETLLGGELAPNLLPVSFEDEHFKISGYVTKPQVSRPIKSDQHLFVNRRPVINKLISGSIKDGYGTLLMPRNYPPFVLFFELPASLVDVNIHPKKEKIAFTDESFVYELFKKAIEQVFTTEDPTYKIGVSEDIDLLKDDTEGYFSFEETGEIAQLHRLYLVKQTQGGILLIDQHAAHERILYEELLERLETGDMDSKELEVPITFTLSVSNAQAMEEHLNSFESLGFEVGLFGKETFKISTIPWFVREQDVLAIIEELLEELKLGKGMGKLDSKTKHLLSTMACKSAIKSGDYLNTDERTKLLEDLEETKTKYTCPHGRPVKLEFSLNELARMFKRK